MHVAKYIADKGNDEDVFSDQLSQLDATRH